MDTKVEIPVHPPIRIVVLGAGSRGNAYARALTVHNSTQATVPPKGIIVGVAEPEAGKRLRFVKNYMGNVSEASRLVYSDWKEYVSEMFRRRDSSEDIGVDGVCICTQDSLHEEMVHALRPLNLHIMCEKPLTTTLESTISLINSITSPDLPPILFAVCHVLRYSPHNLLLKKLLCEDEVLGDIINVSWTEPVGWWHFAHSYVRGNWNNEVTSAPSLLTKCCHDIDAIMWLLAFPHFNPQTGKGVRKKIHHPSRIMSTGHLSHFRPEKKPKKAGSATNCFSCEAEQECIYSAKKIYVNEHLKKRKDTGWPVKIVAPDIEDTLPNWEKAESLLTECLKEDYTTTSIEAPDPLTKYYGRCVYSCPNNVLDNQVVLLSWDDEVDPTSSTTATLPGHTSKTATITLLAHSTALCERRGHISGSKGELHFDTSLPGKPITVTTFSTEHPTRKIYHSSDEYEGGGHGGGDQGLILSFVEAIWGVKYQGVDIREAQRWVMGMTAEEVGISHGVVWGAEVARREEKVVRWEGWWEEVYDKRQERENPNRHIKRMHTIGT